MADDRVKRSDAAANRERLLTAAGELIVARGIGVPMREIAEAAGLGPATLYRNFANRHELLMTLADRMRERYTTIVDRATATEDGWRAIELFVDESWRMFVDMPWVGVVRGYAVRFEPPRAELEDALHSIVQRAWDQGSLRTDIEWTDVLFIPTLFAGFVGYPEPVRSIVVGRLRRIVFDGLHPEAPRAPEAGPGLGLARFREFVDLPARAGADGA